MDAMHNDHAHKPHALWLCRTPQDFILPAGSTVLMPSMWTFCPEGRTAAYDIECTLDEDTLAIDALSMLERKSMALLAREGGTELRNMSLKEIRNTGKYFLFYWED